MVKKKIVSFVKVTDNLTHKILVTKVVELSFSDSAGY